MFSFVLNSASFGSKLSGQWSAAFKTGSETVKLMGCGLEWQATETTGGVTKLSSLCCFAMFDAIGCFVNASW